MDTLLFLLRSPLAIRQSPRLGEPILDHWNQGALHQLLDQFRMGVVRSGGFSLRPLNELEGKLTVFVRKDRLQVEQALVDATQFLDIEGGVVDAPGQRTAVFPVGGQVPKGFEKVVVGEVGGVEILSPVEVEELTVERWDVEQAAQFLAVEETESGL